MRNGCAAYLYGIHAQSFVHIRRVKFRKLIPRGYAPGKRVPLLYAVHLLSSVHDIVDLLHEEGLIQMPWLMKAYIRFSDKEDGFLNGSYELSSNMSKRV